MTSIGRSDQLRPEEIRKIRESLGLTQAQASKEFGGGPKAFAKYEAGTTKPSKSMMKLLLIAEQYPSLFVESHESRHESFPGFQIDALQVTAGHITELKPDELTELPGPFHSN